MRRRRKWRRARDDSSRMQDAQRLFEQRQPGMTLATADIWAARRRPMSGLQRSMLLMACVAAVSGCGGGGGGATVGYVSGGTASAVPVQGIYFGQYTISGDASPVNVYGAIDAGGFGYFADTFGDFFLLPPIAGTGQFAGQLTVHAPLGQVFPGGGAVQTFQLSGTVSSDAVFVSGQFSNDTSSGSLQLNYEPLSISRVSIAAGSYQGFYWGNGGDTAITLTVNVNATFTGVDGYGCELSGSFTPVQGVNLYTVTLDSAGSAICPGKLTGLAFAGPDDLTGQFGGARGLYVYLGAANSTGGFAAEFWMQ